jgi:hypothetical protein
LKIEESRAKKLLSMNQMIKEPVDELIQYALESSVLHSHSELGYVVFFNRKEEIERIHVFDA